MKYLLSEIEQGFDAVMANKEIVSKINGQMTFFPLCCSTGIIKNLTASQITNHDRLAFEANNKITGVEVQKITDAKYIHEIVRAANGASRPIFFPLAVARWNALSLILAKTIEGKDDGPAGGYNNYKAAQITMCDRIIADKRNPKFKFASYNIVFSVDQLMDYLEGSPLGEFYASPAVPGGHGARVRAGIFTPDHKALQEYHDERIERVREHVLLYLKSGVPQKIEEAVDSVAAKW